MVEVTYTEGYNIMSPLSKGKAIVGMYVTGVATGETITTPFARCVPVVSPGAALVGNADHVYNITESAAGVVSFGIAGTNPATDFQVIIIGDLY